MRTTLNLNSELFEKAKELTGISEKTALINQGLELLIQKEAAKRLAKLGGIDPSVKPITRKRRAIK